MPFFLMAQPTTEEAVFKGIADRYFEKSDFNNAFPLYKGLLEKNETNAEYNYKYGVCLFFTDTDKASCIRYLLYAVSRPQISPLCSLYLAKAFHYNYHFDDAINFYENFKQTAGKPVVARNNIDLQIQYCLNARLMIANPVSTEILERHKTDRRFFTSAYEVFLPDAKVYSVAGEFMSKTDIKSGTRPMMCLYNNENEAVFSSYGPSPKNGKDLFRKVRLGHDEWSKSRTLGKEINSPNDEDFPYVTTDGSRLYYSSKGPGSMGGYDIFKCDWDEFLQKWSMPVNLGYPINSPSDDFLFITVPEKEIAYLATDRNSPAGKIEILKIKYPKEIINWVIIKGKFEVAGRPEIRKAQITVIDTHHDELSGMYTTNGRTGEYLIILTPGVKYRFLVKVKGYEEHSALIEIPVPEKKYPYRQDIRIEENNQVETALFYNYFINEDIIRLKSPDGGQVIVRASSVVKSEKIKYNALLSQANPVISDENKPAEQTSLTGIEKEANNSYKIGDYSAAMQYYLQLLAKKPSDPGYNYRMGICVMNSSRDKSMALPYFEKASSSTTTPVDVYYYLGRCCHLSGKFETAILRYEKYKSVVSPVESSGREMDRLIEQCKNGRTLQKTQPLYEIINKKLVFTESIYLSLTTYEFSGKFLMAPDEFRTPLDIKKNFKSVIFLSADRSTIYYSSYGSDGKTGKDIYKRIKLPSGEWSDAEYQYKINSPMDEDFPFLSPDGGLFFSSMGFTSMGGYDIFNTTWNYQEQAWNTPKNLGMPVNSPADDTFFILCKDGESVYFSTDRNSAQGSAEIFNARKIK